MSAFQKQYYAKRARILVQNLQSRHFDAWYCETCAEALEKALSLIPEGCSVGWGGALSAQQIGLIDAVRKGNYRAIDRDACKPEERNAVMRACLDANVFLTGAMRCLWTGKW